MVVPYPPKYAASLKRGASEAVFVSTSVAEVIHCMGVGSGNESFPSFQLSGGVDWRSRLDTQKGAVLATELQNNSCKLAKWTLQALLAGSDVMKFGYSFQILELLVTSNKGLAVRRGTVGGGERVRRWVGNIVIITHPDAFWSSRMPSDPILLFYWRLSSKIRRSFGPSALIFFLAQDPWGYLSMLLGGDAVLFLIECSVGWGTVRRYAVCWRRLPACFLLIFHMFPLWYHHPTHNLLRTLLCMVCIWRIFVAIYLAYAFLRLKSNIMLSEVQLIKIRSLANTASVIKTNHSKNFAVS